VSHVNISETVKDSVSQSILSFEILGIISQLLGIYTKLYRPLFIRTPHNKTAFNCRRHAVILHVCATMYVTVVHQT